MGQDTFTGQEITVEFREWVISFLMQIEHPTSQGGAFCQRWWLHPEAVARLKALYWEYCKAELVEGGLSSWWVNHWEVHSRALFNPQTGVFRDCTVVHRPDNKRVRDVVLHTPADAYDEAFEDQVLVGYPFWISNRRR